MHILVEAVSGRSKKIKRSARDQRNASDMSPQVFMVLRVSVVIRHVWLGFGTDRVSYSKREFGRDAKTIQYERGRSERKTLETRHDAA